MLSVAFHSLGALSIIIDRTQFNTFVFDTKTVNEFVAWLYKADDRIKLLLVEGLSLARMLRLDTLDNVRVILSESPDKIREAGLPNPIDCDLTSTGCDIKKLTCKNINQMILDDIAPANIAAKPVEGSRSGKLLQRIKDIHMPQRLSDDEVGRFKKTVCEQLVNVASSKTNDAIYGKALKAAGSKAKKLERYITKNQDRMFAAYADMLLGNTIGTTSLLHGVSNEDLRLVIKYVPLKWYKFTKPLPISDIAMLNSGG